MRMLCGVRLDTSETRKLVKESKCRQTAASRSFHLTELSESCLVRLLALNLVTEPLIICIKFRSLADFHDFSYDERMHRQCMDQFFFHAFSLMDDTRKWTRAQRPARARTRTQIGYCTSTSSFLYFCTFFFSWQNPMHGDAKFNLLSECWVLCLKYSTRRKQSLVHSCNIRSFFFFKFHEGYLTQRWCPPRLHRFLSLEFSRLFIEIMFRMQSKCGVCASGEKRHIS